jgi:alkyldihydroxyacetonephosphate synthase
MPYESVIGALSDALGPDAVSTRRPDRIAYSGDLWPRLQVDKLRGKVGEHQPDCVVWAKTRADVEVALAICDDLRVPIVPYGAGSGVCGGTIPVRGGVVIDVRGLDRILDIDPEGLTVLAEGGILGHHLEAALAEQGLTLGHFPSSILCSSLGGYVAARSAGQCSSRYGKIEDMVLGLEVVLPGGRVMRTGLLGGGDTFDWTAVLVGSEGTLGIVTSALLRVHPAPEARSFRGFRFRGLVSALDGMRRILQEPLRPSVLRLYDPLDTMLHYGPKHGAALFKYLHGRSARGTSAEPQPAEPEHGLLHRAKERLLGAAFSQARVVNRVGHWVSGGAVLIVGTEGLADVQADEMRRIQEICAAGGADDLGEGPGLAWYERRYAVSFKQAGVFSADAFVDTMEVATTWGRVVALYDAVRSAVSRDAVVMAHFSHAYPEGCSIYFTFAGRGQSPDDTLRIYDRVWAAGLDAVVRAGATVSHHHGVGLSKREALSRESGDGGSVFYALKGQLDPHGIMNPGKLYPPPGERLDAAGGLQ